MRPFATVSRSSAIRPNAVLNNIVQIEGTGNSSYKRALVDGHQASFARLQFSASYTFSKSIDYKLVEYSGRGGQDS